MGAELSVVPVFWVMYKCHLARWAGGTMKDGRDSGSYGNGSPMVWRDENPLWGEAKIQIHMFQIYDG